MHDELVSILTSFLGEPRKHNHTKGQVAYDCPACSSEKGLLSGDGKGNLEINYYKGVYKCWACYQTNHMSGGIYHLVRNYGSRQNISEFLLIAKELKFDIEFKSTSSEIISELPPEFHSLLQKSSNFDYRLAIEYLAQRNIDREIIEKFNLGYCPTGKYAGRIIVPSYDVDGVINYFSGRTYRKGVKPKYLNPDTDKTTIIFNEHKINWDATIYLVEGPFDHLVVPNSIPLLGKYLDFDYLMFEKIYEKAKGLVVIVLDGDAKSDAKKLFFKLNSGNLRGRVKVVLDINEKYDMSKIYEVMGKRGIILALKKAEKLPEYMEIY